MQKHFIASLLALSVASFTPALAAGDNSASPSKPKLTCKQGEVVKKIKKDGKTVNACVKISSGILPDEDLYQQGRELAKAGQYESALEVLGAVQNQNDPRVLNYIGYSNRKAGRVELGITYYRKALEIDPDFVLAREYLGEGYVAMGRIDFAKAELEEISKRCGLECEEYKDLSEAIASAS